MKKKLWLFILLLVLAASVYTVIAYYPYVFAKHLEGVVVGVERVTQPTAIIGSGRSIPPEQLYSFAVAIRDDKTSEIFTASSEDRQWAVVVKGQCAEAKFFPYAPWDLDKAGTYSGARLLRLYDCPAGTQIPPTTKPADPGAGLPGVPTASPTP